MLPIIAWLCIATTTAAAETAPGAGPALPRFEDFPAGPAFRGRNHLLLGREDMGYRTRLRIAARQAPDFAGHYVLSVWGCGTECLMGAAIDVRSGKVAWLPGTLCCWYSDKAGHGGQAEPFEPLRYRFGSRLLVLTGRRNERDGDDGDHYYVIEGSRLVHLRDVPPGAKRP